MKKIEIITNNKCHLAEIMRIRAGIGGKVQKVKRDLKKV